MLNSARYWRPMLAVTGFALLAACSDHDHDMRQSSATPADSEPTMMHQTAMGNVMTTPAGMTVYTYDHDTAGKSNCTGECAEYWPALIVAPGSAESAHMTMIKREDGRMQWATATGMPLYTYVDDKAPGEIKGDNFHNEWHIVK